MARETKETCFTLTRLWAAAICLHHQSMIGEESRTKGWSDREWLSKVDKLRDQSSIPTKDDLRRFANEYSLNRGRSLPEDKREEFYKITTKAVSGWSNEMPLEEKAKSLRDSLPKKYAPVSATSKFAWFMEPEYWTLFDSRAASGLKAGQFIQFYKKLDGLQIKELLSEMRQVNGFPAELFPSRILDKLLYIMGGNDNYKQIQSSGAAKFIPIASRITQLDCSDGIQSFLKKEYHLQ